MGKEAVRPQDDERPEADVEAIDWRRLYDEHAPRIRRIAANRVPQAAVDDIVQETFLRAFRNRRRIDEHTSITRWLHGIALRASVDGVRHLAVVSTNFDDLVPALEQAEELVVTRRRLPGKSVVSKRRRRPPTMGSVTLLEDDDELYFSTGERWEAAGHFA